MPKKLLLADDSITIQKVVGITFAAEDYEITAVDNGEDALAKARALRPDVILADVVMPRKNGYELCEAVKADPELQRIPVVLLAGTFEAFDENRARAARADGHIAKPFESGALIAKVRELVEGVKPAVQPAARPAAPARPVGPPGPAAPPAQPPTARPAAPGFGAARPMPGTAPAAGFRPGPGMPPGARPAAPGAAPPGAPPGFRPPMPGAMPPPGAPPGFRPAPPGAMPPAGARPPGPMPGMRPPGPGMAPPGMAPRPGMPPGAPPPGARPTMPGAMRGAPPGARPHMPGPVPPAASPMRPMPPQGGAPMARPPGAPAPAARPAAPAPPAAAPPPGPEPRARESFGFDLGAPAGVRKTEAEADFAELGFGEKPLAAPLAPQAAAPPAAAAARGGVPKEIALEEEVPGPAPLELGAEETTEEVQLAPVPDLVPPPAATGHQPALAGDGGEAALREALGKASIEVIERVVWEVVPQLAETIIRENLERLTKERQGS